MRVYISGGCGWANCCGSEGLLVEVLCGGVAVHAFGWDVILASFLCKLCVLCVEYE